MKNKEITGKNWLVWDGEVDELSQRGIKNGNSLVIVCGSKSVDTPPVLGDRVYEMAVDTQEILEYFSGTVESPPYKKGDKFRMIGKSKNSIGRHWKEGWGTFCKLDSPHAQFIGIKMDWVKVAYTLNPS